MPVDRLAAGFSVVLIVLAISGADRTAFCGASLEWIGPSSGADCL